MILVYTYTYIYIYICNKYIYIYISDLIDGGGTLGLAKSKHGQTQIMNYLGNLIWN